MSNYIWHYPNTVWFGNGRIKDLGKACKILNINKPLFVTDKDLVKKKIVEETLDINKKSNLPTTIFSDLKGGGKALILGLCVAFMGLAVDNLIRTWANKRKKLLGLEEY